jgi:putative heme iron utilization protein
MSCNEELDRIAEEARAFMAGFKTLLLATANADGKPLASYAPFVTGPDQSFYIYVSGLSQHTRDLDETRAASVLFIEDETHANQPFARKRLVLDCRVQPISRDSNEWHRVLDGFSETFGEVMKLLKPLADFKMFRLAPKQGMYVRGFGKAYRFNGGLPADLEHVKV